MLDVIDREVSRPTVAEVLERAARRTERGDRLALDVIDEERTEREAQLIPRAGACIVIDCAAVVDALTAVAAARADAAPWPARSCTRGALVDFEIVSALRGLTAARRIRGGQSAVRTHRLRGPADPPVGCG